MSEEIKQAVEEITAQLDAENVTAQGLKLGVALFAAKMEDEQKKKEEQ